MKSIVRPMRRGKVVLRRIGDKMVRKVTFSNRRQGQFKKLRKLPVLCSADVAGFDISSTRRSYFASYPASLLVTWKALIRVEEGLGHLQPEGLGHYMSLDDTIQLYHKHNLSNGSLTKDGMGYQPDSMQTLLRYFMDMRVEDLNMNELVVMETEIFKTLKEVIHWKIQMIEKSNNNLREKVEFGTMQAEKGCMNKEPEAILLSNK